MKLGVNVDHVATLRQARKTVYPDPVFCALLAESAGADSIVMHLREDRRHIQESDLLKLKDAVKIPVNLEMAVNPSIVKFALKYKPFQATIVPERRRELTTEGGLDLTKNFKRITQTVKQLQAKNIKVSLFVAPSLRQVELAKKTGAENIEIHTGHYCDAKTPAIRKAQLKMVITAAKAGHDLGMFVAAGHGINYDNVTNIAGIKHIEELNIGHAIIARAVYIGLANAVEEMKELI
jgi:pyridoxine 5-phosphate synthase